MSTGIGYSSNSFIGLKRQGLGRGCGSRGTTAIAWALGWFVAGVGLKPGEQITYHLPLEMFDDVQVPELEKAPSYDGHTAADVLERLKRL